MENLSIEDFIANNKDKIQLNENAIEIEEVTHYELENVICFEDKEKYTGKLILTNLNVKFVCEGENEEIKAWNYQEIIMHSISKSTLDASFPPCIYCHLDSEEVAELRFVPADENSLLPMFEALSKGAELNPDERDEDDEEGNFYFNKDEFPGLDMNSMNNPDVFFKLGEGNQIEIYDDGEGEEYDDDDEEGEEGEDKYGKLDINFAYIEKNNEKFEDADGDAK
jgi:hypothetical protein